jgi:anti-sigma factor RsiW
MTLPEVHLTPEAIAAYVDEELAPVPCERARHHIATCAQCQADVAAQRQAKTMLGVAALPAPPDDLLARLRQIPMSASIGGERLQLAAGSEGLAVRTAPEWPADPGLPAAAVVGAAPAPRTVRLEPSAWAHRMRLASAGLLGGAAIVAVGVFAASGPSGVNQPDHGVPVAPADAQYGNVQQANFEQPGDRVEQPSGTGVGVSASLQSGNALRSTDGADLLRLVGQ